MAPETFGKIFGVDNEISGTPSKVATEGRFGSDGVADEISRQVLTCSLKVEVFVEVK